MRVSAARAGSRLGGALVGALALLALLAGGARAADSVYWADFTKGRIFHASLAGGPATEVPFPNAGKVGIGGVAVDPAAGKIYWTEFNPAAIMVANLDGSGARPLNTAGSGLDSPLGITIDTSAGQVYWANRPLGGEGEAVSSSISFANVDGSGGGAVDTAGASLEFVQGVTVHPAAGRLYWADTGANKLSFANLAGGGGILDIDPDAISGPIGVAIDAASQRIFWANVGVDDTIGVAQLNGSGGTKLTPAGIEDPVGVALDTAANRLYWAQATSPAIKFANPFDGSAVGDVATGLDPEGQPIFPVLLKAPLNLKPPSATGKATPGGTLTCAGAAWAPDAPEARLYRAAQTTALQWLRNGQPIPGATAATLSAQQVGTYACQSVATNFAGATTATSAQLEVKASLKLKRAKLNKKNGTATLTLSVDTAGAIVLGGKGVRKAKKLAGRAGTYKLTIRATGKSKRKLLASGRAKVKAQVAFTPLGGKALKQTKSIVLRDLP
ncbi:MAG TPA: hypothetical protein VFX45_06695 [Solirubrobacterales bacterium]|nr:hypothetical protein [Solirubrobacterales bacterium]